MKLQVANFVDPTRHTDRELVLLYFLTQVWRRDGYDTKLYMHALDVKTILRGTGHGAAMPDIPGCAYLMQTLKYTDKTMAFILHSDLRKSKTDRPNKRRFIRHGLHTVEIKDPKAIAIAIYLMGIVNSGAQLTQDGIRIEQEDCERERRLTPIEFRALTKQEVPWPQDFED